MIRADAPPLILASASAARRALCEAVGLPVTVEPARVDEASVKESLAADGASAAIVAETLADLKAASVARRHPDAVVIGADQMLECAGVWFDKPPDRAHASAQLQALSGKTHTLWSAVVLHRGGQRIWHTVERADLTMRPLSRATIDTYLDAAGVAVLSSVGAYQIEALGQHLFTRIVGDQSTILGLPMLPLLGFLRQHGVVV